MGLQIVLDADADIDSQLLGRTRYQIVLDEEGVAQETNTGTATAIIIEGGPRGAAGRSIVSVERTAGTGDPGTTDTYTITYSDATTSTFTITNGEPGAVTSVNGIDPVSGDVTLTAVDVGARPDTWVPDWAEVTSKPATFPPSSHLHSASDVSSGTFDPARLPAASTTVAGAVEAATDSEASAGIDMVRYVTPKHLADLYSKILNAPPSTLDTLDEIAAALGDDPNFATTMMTALAGKQPLDTDLTQIAGLASAADRLPYATGPGAWALATFTAFARSLLDDADQASARATLGVAQADLDSRYSLRTIAEKASTDAPSTYPTGVSVFNVETVTGWPGGGLNGTVVTYRISDSRGYQTFTDTQNHLWARSMSSEFTSGWSPWSDRSTVVWNGSTTASAWIKDRRNALLYVAPAATNQAGDFVVQTTIGPNSNQRMFLLRFRGSTHNASGGIIDLTVRGLWNASLGTVTVGSVINAGDHAISNVRFLKRNSDGMFAVALTPDPGQGGWDYLRVAVDVQSSHAGWVAGDTEFEGWSGSLVTSLTPYTDLGSVVPSKFYSPINKPAPSEIGAMSTTSGGQEAIQSIGLTGSVTVNLSVANYFYTNGTITGAVTPSFVNVPAAGVLVTVRVEYQQGATPQTVNLPTGGRWFGAAPTQVANKTCVVTYRTRDGGTTWNCTAEVQV